nr:MAG TPA: hypothetical protein [Caudoviricetes sp.]
MTDKNKKSINDYLHDALNFIAKQELLAAYGSVCCALGESGGEFTDAEAAFVRFALISAGEEVSAAVEELNAGLRTVKLDIPSRAKDEPPRVYLLYIGEDERNTCYRRINPKGKTTVFYDEECKHWRAENDTESEKA